MGKNRSYRPRHAVDRPDPVWKRPSDTPSRSGVRLAAVGGVLVAGLAGALLPGTSFAASGGGARAVAVSAPAGSLATPVTLLGARSAPVTARPMQQHDVQRVDAPARRAYRLAPAVGMSTLAVARNEVSAGLNSRARPTAAQDTQIPASAFAAYRAAEVNLAQADSSCHLPWWILAGVGRIESGHAAGGRVDADGTTLGPILSATPTPGRSGSFVPDTDGGLYDHSSAYDRAVGPMQIMPAVWTQIGRDGNGDGVADPDNVFDSATTAGALMCSVGGNLSQPQNMAKALLAMDGSTAYVQSVVSWGVAYRTSATVTDNATGLVPTTPQEQPLTVIPLVNADGQQTLPTDDGTVTTAVGTPTQDPTAPPDPVPTTEPTQPSTPTQDPTITVPGTEPQPSTPATQPPVTTPPVTTTQEPPPPPDPVETSTTTTSDVPVQEAPSPGQQAPAAQAPPAATAQAPAAAAQQATGSPLAATPASTEAAAPAAAGSAP